MRLLLKLKGEIERKFCPATKVPNFGGFGASWSLQELEKVSIFTAKGTSMRESTSFKPFCVKIG